MPGITFKTEDRWLGSVFRFLPERAWALTWRATVDFELVPGADSGDLVEQVYRLADAGDPLPTGVVRQLVELDPQVIGGELRGFREGAEQPDFIPRSVRGDQWDIEAADPDELSAIAEQVSGSQPHPYPTL